VINVACVTVSNHYHKMSHFYLTLPSNSSMKYYPDNTLAQFKTRLLSTIDLTGDWECGLSEIIYSNSWMSIARDQWVTVYFVNDNPKPGR